MGDDTIIAISTPLGSSLKSIIRLNGPRAFELVEKNFRHRSSSSLRLKDYPCYTSKRGYLILKESALTLPMTLYLMKAPRSYTKEDVVEIHTLGVLPLLESIVEEFTRLGARLAAPGEFTQRAFLNGRIDLAQAEAVLEIIRSRNEREFQLAAHHLTGNFSRRINNIHQNLIDLLARIEISLDFSDQDIEIISPQEIKKKINQVAERVRGVLHTSTQETTFRDGIITVLCGRPNVGKSSIFNRLVRDKKTIVTRLPGTTRDVIEGPFKSDEHTFRIFDTAGIQDFSKIPVIDQKASRHTQRVLSQADLFVFIVDGSRKLSVRDRDIFKKSTPARRLLVINKIDLPRKTNPAGVKTFLDGPDLPTVQTSALSGRGINTLKKKLSELVRNQGVDRSSSDSLINTRHRLTLTRALDSLEKALGHPDHGTDSYELIALDLREALDAVGEISGKVFTDDILNHIFSQFCIGK